LTEDALIQPLRVLRPPHIPHRKNLVDEQQPARIDRGQSPRHRRPPPANATNATDTSCHTAPDVSAITTGRTSVEMPCPGAGTPTSERTDREGCAHASLPLGWIHVPERRCTAASTDVTNTNRLPRLVSSAN